MYQLTPALLLLVLSGCVTQTDTYEISRVSHPEAKASELKKCPWGHEALRDVPVVNGLLLWTPELHRKVDALELWAGGCMGTDSNKVVCMKCRYAYEQSSKLWEKSGASKDEFSRPLSKWIAAFPVQQAPGSSATYFQSVDGMGQVEREQIIYWFRQIDDQFVETVVNYMNPTGPVNVHPIKPAQVGGAMQCEIEGFLISVEITRHGPETVVTVRSEKRREMAE